MVIHVYLFDTNCHEFFMNYFYGVLEYRSYFSPILLSSVEFYFINKISRGIKIYEN